MRDRENTEVLVNIPMASPGAPTLTPQRCWTGMLGEPCPGLVGALQESASLLKINQLWFIYPGKGAAGFPAPGPRAVAAVFLPSLRFQPSRGGWVTVRSRGGGGGHFGGLPAARRACSSGAELGVCSQPSPWVTILVLFPEKTKRWRKGAATCPALEPPSLPQP